MRWIFLLTSTKTSILWTKIDPHAHYLGWFSIYIESVDPMNKVFNKVIFN